MKVRRATQDDAHAIADVSVTTWRQAYRHILPLEFLDALDVTGRASRVAKIMGEGAVYWVAETEERIVGFVTAGRNIESAVEAEAELKAIYVLPGFQGAGVGKALLLEAVRYVRDQGFTSMCVYAFLENQAAREFYLSLGAQLYDTSTFTIDGVEYPDQSYLWGSVDVLFEHLNRGQVDLSQA